MSDIVDRLHELWTVAPNRHVEDVLKDAEIEIERLTAERDFAIAAHDGQAQDKDYLAGQCARLTAERDRLRAAIQNYLDGNYPHANKTYKCPHGLYGYEACENCIDEHFQRALAEQVDRE